MCPNHSSPPSILSSGLGPILIHFGWSRSAQDLLSPMRCCPVVWWSGQSTVMWKPLVSGCPHGQDGDSTLPILCSQLFWGPRSVLIQVYAESAL